MDSNNKLPKDIIEPRLIKDIVDNNSHCIKIYNHSIASIYPCRKKNMSPWAAEIDLLSFNNNILIIQAAGNLKTSNSNHFCLGIRQHLENNRNYPDYLLMDSCRISNPAQSLNALTVGSINPDSFYDEITGERSLGEKDHPSAFSKTGPGLWGSIKPEVVEYGGGWVITEGNNCSFVPKAEMLPELIRRSPPAFAKDSLGTSFSTPKVTHIAAKLQSLFPDSSPLLYRALIVNSAEWPEYTNQLNENQYLNIIRHIGYGLPSLDKAIGNNEHRITFITAEKVTINPQKVHTYKIPIPEEIRNPANEQNIKIEVTLSYSAKPRRTRINKNGYLSSWLHWDATKTGENISIFENRMIKDGDKAKNATDTDQHKWVIGMQEDWGLIKGISRTNSTLQKDWKYVPSYDLPEIFAVAVVSHHGWDKDPESEAFYSLVVSFEAVNEDIAIYNEIKFAFELEQEEQELDQLH